MIRSTLFLLLMIFINNNLVAQDPSSEKKAVAPNIIGIKKQSITSRSIVKKSKAQNPGPLPVDKHTMQSAQNMTNKASVKATSKALETIKVDYRDMPAEVQSKINSNKLSGNYLLEGIAKEFRVEIKTCLTDADQKKTLSFLKTKNGFIHSQLVSAGVVALIVDPTFDSADLKDAMGAQGIQCNFLSRSYLLKN